MSDELSLNASVWDYQNLCRRIEGSFDLALPQPELFARGDAMGFAALSAASVKEGSDPESIFIVSGNHPVFYRM